jgi:hypothetical protein
MDAGATFGRFLCVIFNPDLKQFLMQLAKLTPRCAA